MKQVASANIEASAGWPPRSRLQTWLSVADSKAAVIFLIIAGALWLASALGLDPTNDPQLGDFQQFHFPSVRTFARHPLAEALTSYRAAPFPLFYILGGWLYRATESEAVLRIWTVSMALGILAFVFALARRATGLRSTVAPLVVALAMTSPYFRGQSVYANTDILALLFAFGALYAFGESTPRFPSIRACAALFLACCAGVHTAILYLLAGIPLRPRLGERDLAGTDVGSTLFSAVLAAPVIGLVLLWGRITPRGFSQHAANPSLQHSVPAVLLLVSFYATPLAVVTAWMYRDAFLRDLRLLRLRLMMAPAVALGRVLDARAPRNPRRSRWRHAGPPVAGTPRPGLRQSHAAGLGRRHRRVLLSLPRAPEPAAQFDHRAVGVVLFFRRRFSTNDTSTR